MQVNSCWEMGALEETTRVTPDSALMWRDLKAELRGLLWKTSNKASNLKKKYYWLYQFLLCLQDFLCFEALQAALRHHAAQSEFLPPRPAERLHRPERQIWICLNTAWLNTFHMSLITTRQVCSCNVTSRQYELTCARPVCVRLLCSASRLSVVHRQTLRASPAWLRACFRVFSLFFQLLLRHCSCSYCSFLF